MRLLDFDAEQDQEPVAIEERLIVGLGNPESEYADTRHNLGFACVRELARRLGVRVDRKRWQSLVGHSEAHGIWLVLPQTYMNLSGQAVAKAVRDLRVSPPQNVWVVYDELDLPLCRMRIRRGGSGAGHNGVLSLISSLGTPDFVRFRVGIGKPAAQGISAGPPARPGRFTKAEAERLPERRSTGSPSALELALEAGVERAMDRYNRPGSLGCEELAMSSLWKQHDRRGARRSSDGSARAIGELSVGRLPRAAWPIVAGVGGASLRRAAAGPFSILVPAPDRFADELRPWLAGRPAGPRLCRGRGLVPGPPAGLRRRGEQAPRGAGRARPRRTGSPSVVVSSRRAITRQTISPGDLRGRDAACSRRAVVPIRSPWRSAWSSSGYSREPLVEDRGQFSLRGGILDVFPAAADAPVRAEWAGDVDRDAAPVRSREPALGDGGPGGVDPDGARAAARAARAERPRSRGSVSRSRSRACAPTCASTGRTSWRASKPARRFPASSSTPRYLDPSRPSLLDHLPADIAGARLRARAPARRRPLADRRDRDARGRRIRRRRAAATASRFRWSALDRLDEFAGRPAGC